MSLGAHTYFVRAFDAAANMSLSSNTASVTILPPPDTQVPTAPSSLLAALGVGKVTLWWTASTDNVGVTGYKIYRDDVLVGSSNTAKYYDTVSPIGVHGWQIKATDAAGNP